MIEANIVNCRAGDFVLMQSDHNWYIGVLIPNFYANSHFDVSKNFTLTEHDIENKDDFDYLIKLAETIRKNVVKFSDREVGVIKLIK